MKNNLQQSNKHQKNHWQMRFGNTVVNFGGGMGGKIGNRKYNNPLEFFDSL